MAQAYTNFWPQLEHVCHRSGHEAQNLGTWRLEERFGSLVVVSAAPLGGMEVSREQARSLL